MQEFNNRAGARPIGAHTRRTEVPVTAMCKESYAINYACPASHVGAGEADK